MNGDAIKTDFNYKRLFEVSIMIWVVPWCIWVTISIFNQRQELAITREILMELKSQRTSSGALLSNFPPRSLLVDKKSSPRFESCEKFPCDLDRS